MFKGSNIGLTSLKYKIFHIGHQTVWLLIHTLSGKQETIIQNQQQIYVLRLENSFHTY